jgi:hypothetical protein
MLASCKGACDSAALTKAVAALRGSRLSSTQFALSQNGGGGGSPFRLACPDGKLIVGLRGNSGGGLDAVGPVCSSIDDPAAGVPGETAGGTGGAVFDTRCPPGQVGVGLFGRSGAEVDALGLACADLKAWAAGPTRAVRLAPNGGTGGRDYEALCPSGYVMVGLEGRSGAHIDRIGGYCARVE